MGTRFSAGMLVPEPQRKVKEREERKARKKTLKRTMDDKTTFDDGFRHMKFP